MKKNTQKGFIPLIIAGLVAIATLVGAYSINSSNLNLGGQTINPLPVRNFLGLTDTPDSYSGQGGKSVVVKSDATGLEFGTSPSSMVYPGAGIALSTGSAWDTSITNNSSNWNTAFGWGNHASAGYLTDAASDGNTYGRKNGAWSAVTSGSDDVVGPASAVGDHVVLFNGTTGKLIKDSGLTLSGTNTGDNAINSLYSGLAASKQDALSGTGFLKFSGTTPSYDNSTYTPTSTTVAGHALSSNVSISMDDLSDAITSTPLVDQILKFNGTNWINGNETTVNGGAGVELFYVEAASDIGGYSQLLKSPDTGGELDETVVANNNEVLINEYASTSTGLGGTKIDAGIWSFDIWSYVDVSLSGSSSIKIDIYKRTSGGTETLLFSVNSGSLMTALGTEPKVATTVQPEFAINATDRLVAKVYGKNTASVNRTIHFFHGGTTHYSHINAPLVIRHNDLAGLQGGTSNEFYHLTSTEYTGTGTGVFARASSPVFTTPNIGSATGSITGNAGTVTNGVLTTSFTNNGGAGILTWPAAGATLTIPTGGGTLGTAAFTAASAYATSTQGTTADNAVPKATYDANTVLYATTDNTPVALTVPASTFVGRKSTGDISAMSATEARTVLNVADGATANTKATGAEIDTGTDDAKFVTPKAITDQTVLLKKSGGTMTGNITLGENTSVAYDPAGSADGKYSGFTTTGTAGTTLAFGDLVYLDPTDSRWELADANIAAGADGDPRGILGMVVLAAAGDGSATVILLNGIIRADTAYPALTINAPVYVSETAGDIVVTQPTTADVVIRVLGFATTADEIYFNPSNDYITHI